MSGVPETTRESFLDFLCKIDWKDIAPELSSNEQNQVDPTHDHLSNFLAEESRKAKHLKNFQVGLITEWSKYQQSTSAVECNPEPKVKVETLIKEWSARLAGQWLAAQSDAERKKTQDSNQNTKKTSQTGEQIAQVQETRKCEFLEFLKSAQLSSLQAGNSLDESKKEIRDTLDEQEQIKTVSNDLTSAWKEQH